jgi:hypothetical protein
MPEVKDILAIWARAVQGFARAFKYCNGPECNTLRAGYVSLVEFLDDAPAMSAAAVLQYERQAPSSRLRWVHWDELGDGAYIGRITYLSKAKRLLHQHPSTKTDFADRMESGTMRILVQCTGVRMRRFKELYCEEMYTEPILVRDFHEAISDIAEFVRPDSHERCMVCKGRAGLSDARFCPLCRTTKHTSCVELVTNVIAESSAGQDVDVFAECIESAPLAMTMDALLATLSHVGSLDLVSDHLCSWCAALVLEAQKFRCNAPARE